MLELLRLRRTDPFDSHPVTAMVLPFCWRSFGLIRCQRNTLATRPLHRDPFAPEFPRQSSVISCLPLLRVCYPFQLKCSCSHAAERGGELQTDREGGWVGDQTPEQSALTREVYFRRLFDFFFPAPPPRCLKPPLVRSLFLRTFRHRVISEV